MFDEFNCKRIRTVNKIYRQIDFNDLLYKSGNTLDFRSITNPKELFAGIKGGDIILIYVKCQQKLFKSN